MSDRILFTGNCHAQYLGAALTYVGATDVRVLGRAFNGPIHFKGTLARMITPTEMMDWFGAPGKDRRILIMQTTPMGRYTVDTRIEKTIPDLIKIKVPYLKFDTIFHRKTSDEPLRNTIRGDHIFNNMSLRKADIDPSHLQDLMNYLAEHPCLFTNNHFTGGLFAKILELSDFSAAFTPEFTATLIQNVSEDLGIPHDNVGMPSDDVIEAMSLKWPETLHKQAIQNLSAMSLIELARNGVAKNQDTEFSLYLYWRMQFHRAKIHGDKAALLRCFLIYKSHTRLYRPWFRNLANLLVENGKPGLAAILAAHRMDYNDFRAHMLSWCLENIAALDQSRMARRAFHESARRNPESNSAIVDRILEALAH